MGANDDELSDIDASRAAAEQRTFAEKLQKLFDTVRAPGGQPYEPGDLADALHEAGVPLAERVVDRLRAGIGGPPSDSTTETIANFFGIESDYLMGDTLDLRSGPTRQIEPASDAAHGVSIETEWPPPETTEPRPTEGVAPEVYAKARNTDPAVLYNSGKGQFKSGRGFAVDFQVRDYDGSARQRYAEGVIIGFWESEAEACRVAEDVNSGRRYGPGHHLHAKAHSAIVIPAWNASDFRDDELPWETREGSAEMVAAYAAQGVPIPQWLSQIVEGFDDGICDGDQARVGEEVGSSVGIRTEETPRSDSEIDPESSSSAESQDSRTMSLDDELVGVLSSTVEVGSVIMTLGTARPNRIVSIARSGIRVSTEKSERQGTGPQLVPAWMIMAAWNHLRRHGELTQKYLVNELNVKRSAFICALLARLPNVEYESDPYVKLRIVDGANVASSVSYGRHAADEEPAAARPLSRQAGVTLKSDDADWADAAEYADRLNRLFDTVHPKDRGPYSSEEVAESLQADGIPLHASSITRLRDGVGSRPADSTTNALAFFFDVDPDYFTEGIDIPEDFASDSPAEQTYSSRRPRSANADGATPRRAEAERPSRRVGADITLTTSDLLVINAGLSRAARYAGQSVDSDSGLMRRLVMLIDEAGSLLLESLNGDASVPLRYLEHVIVDWGETSPSDNGTASEYKWLLELLNRCLDESLRFGCAQSERVEPPLSDSERSRPTWQ